MAPQAHAISTHHLRRHLALLLLTVAAVTTARAATTDTAAPPDPSAAAESRRSTDPSAAASFLRARCATTLYSALCYDSLLPYASEFQTSHARLSRVAADVVAARLRSLSARVKDILHHSALEPAKGSGSGRPSEKDALRDCASTTSAAANLARQSSASLDRLDASRTAANAAGGGGGGSSRQSRWEVSNAKTWLSAAITNVGTCADGLDEAGATASPAGGKEVAAGVVSVRQYTSNALALVNGMPL